MIRTLPTSLLDPITASSTFVLFVTAAVVASAASCSERKSLCAACCSDGECESGMCGTFPDGTHLCANLGSGVQTSCCVSIGQGAEHCQFYYGTGQSEGAAAQASCEAPQPDPHASCTWPVDAGAGSGGPAPTLDNSADLVGPAIGTEAFDASTMRRVVPVNVTTPLAGLSVGPAYLTRLGSTDETAYLSLPVHNTGTGYPCDIKTASYAWRTNTAQIAPPRSPIYLDGSVGAVGTSYLRTCLAPGETGFLIDIEIAEGGVAVFSAVTSIELALSSSTQGKAPAGQLLPTSYNFGKCGNMPTLRVEATAMNAPVRLAVDGLELGPVVFLDADGLPAGWTYVEIDQLTRLDPGQTVHFYSDLGWAPAVSRLQVFLPFRL